MNENQPSTLVVNNKENLAYAINNDYEKIILHGTAASMAKMAVRDHLNENRFFGPIGPIAPWLLFSGLLLFPFFFGRSTSGIVTEEQLDCYDLHVSRYRLMLVKKGH